MATYTPNWNLSKPENTDRQSAFISDYCGNMDIIDQHLGSGGGGHTIIDPLGQNMPSRTGLQFIGASVTDDSVNDKTVVTITGGGGGHNYSTTEQVVGTWIDNKPLYERTYTGLSIALNNDNWVYFNDPVDIDNLVSLTAYYQGTNGLLHCAISEYQRSNSNGIMFAGYPNMNRTVNVLVARYTKTTD